MYIDNQKLNNEVCLSKKNGRFTDECYPMIKEIVVLNTRKCFPPSILSRCAIAFVIAEMEKHLINFNPDHEAKPNSAFNYFNEVSKRAITKFKIKIKY